MNAFSVVILFLTLHVLSDAKINDTRRYIVSGFITLITIISSFYSLNLVSSNVLNAYIIGDCLLYVSTEKLNLGGRVYITDSIMDLMWCLIKSCSA